MDGRDKFGSFENRTGDAAGFQFRIGYHPGVRVYNAASAAATAASAARSAGEPSADGGRALRAVHGGSRQGIDRHGGCAAIPMATR